MVWHSFLFDWFMVLVSDAKALGGSLDIAEAQKLLTISKTVKPIAVRMVDMTFAVAFDQLLKSIFQSRFAVVYGLCDPARNENPSSKNDKLYGLRCSPFSNTLLF
jgi:hypothetical protein